MSEYVKLADKYIVALNLIENIQTVLPDLPENEAVRKLIFKWAKT